jgi:hypothetical protein
MLNKEGGLIKEFESYVNNAIFEDSNLSQIGLPKEMIRTIHTKEEHYSNQYPQMGHTYKSRAAVPMPYNYFIPSPNVEIPDPIKLRGRKSNSSPFQNKEVKSEYTDFAWYLQSIPFGEIRIFVVNPEIDFFMFLYHKQPSKGATGEQYAVIAWDPEKKKAVDYGYSELTTSGVDRLQLRGVHDTKGGNTNGKIQEFVRAMTRQGEKKYAPSLEKPLFIYNIPVAPQEEPRVTRETRTSAKGQVLSPDFLRVFANRFSKIVPKLNTQIKNKIEADANNENGFRGALFPEINELSTAIGGNPAKVQAWLFSKFRDFRKELYNEGRGGVEGAPSAYKKTSGFELEQENEVGISWTGRYTVQRKKFSPDEESRSPETGFREAQPEKYRRDLPTAGDYASIPSMIAKHTLDGVIDKFAAFLVTSKIKTPNVSIAGALGIKSADTDNIFKKSSATGPEEDSESWLF